ncbi:MAG TPA: hypothetical protein VJJ02_02860 [Candidatus Paceibacterota bacterium]
MNDKKAILVLSALLARGVLSPEKTTAVRSAIEVLSWTKFSESRIKSLKVKKEK